MNKSVLRIGGFVSTGIGIVANGLAAILKDRQTKDTLKLYIEKEVSKQLSKK